MCSARYMILSVDLFYTKKAVALRRGAARPPPRSKPNSKRRLHMDEALIDSPSAQTASARKRANRVRAQADKTSQRESRLCELEAEVREARLEAEKQREAAVAAAASEVKAVERSLKAQADTAEAAALISDLKSRIARADAAHDEHERLLERIARAEAERDALAARVEAAEREASEYKDELEVFGVDAIKSATAADERILGLSDALHAAEAKAEEAEASAAEKREAALAQLRTELASEHEQACAALERAHANVIATLEQRALVSEARAAAMEAAGADASRVSLAPMASTASQRLSMPPLDSPAPPAEHTADGDETSPHCETPTWLREADGLAQTKADEDARRAEETRQRAAADAAAADAASAAAAAASAALERKERELNDAQLQATTSLAELRDRCAALHAEKEGLAREKGELVAELARTAGHLNHKQKIHYVAKLKAENDTLKEALKNALAGSTTGAGKENRRNGTARPAVA